MNQRLALLVLLFLTGCAAKTPPAVVEQPAPADPAALIDETFQRRTVCDWSRHLEGPAEDTQRVAAGVLADWIRQTVTAALPLTAAMPRRAS